MEDRTSITVGVMDGLSNHCGLTSCRFWRSGECSNQEQRRECLAVAILAVPDKADKALIYNQV